MGALVERKRGARGGWRAPIESYPSQQATGTFGLEERNRQRTNQCYGPDAEPNAGECAQCNAFLLPEEVSKCWHCGSDNTRNRRLPSTG